MVSHITRVNSALLLLLLLILIIVKLPYTALNHRFYLYSTFLHFSRYWSTQTVVSCGPWRHDFGGTMPKGVFYVFECCEVLCCQSVQCMHWQWYLLVQAIVAEIGSWNDMKRSGTIWWVFAWPLTVFQSFKLQQMTRSFNLEICRTGR